MRGHKMQGKKQRVALEKVQLARTYYDQGNYPAATDAAAAALALDPANEPAHLLRAGAAAMSGDHGVAAKHFRAAQALRPSKETLLALGECLRKAGDHDEALVVLEGVVRNNPELPNGYSQLALTLEAKGNLDAAEALCRDAVQRFPLDVRVFISYGQFLRRQARIAEAEAVFRNALAQFPGVVQVWDHLAALLANCPGREEESIACYQQAATLEPAVRRYVNIGSLFNRLGRTAEALPFYQEALALDPNYADAYNDLGFIYHGQGMFADAEFCFRRAAALDKNRYEFLSNLAAALSAQGRSDEAEQCLLAAIALKPDSANPYHILASIYLERKQPEVAMALEREGLQVEPHFLLGLTQLAVLEADAGRLDVAIDLYRQAYDVSHKDAMRVLSAMLLPPIMGDRQEILASRQRMSDALDELLADQNIRVEIPDLSLLVDSGFYLAFHGLDDREILSKYSRTLRHACPELNWVNPRLAQISHESGRLRIGFVSKFLFSHSVAAAFGPIIKALAAREDIDVFMVSLGAEQVIDPVHLELINSVDHYVALPDADLLRARDVIAELVLDVLVFPDLGMHAFSNFLAHFRLAPVQCCFNGHPDASGISTVDYRFSWDEPWEVPGAENHYSEKLVRLRYGGAFLPPPQAQVAAEFSRESLGLSSRRAYAVPAKLQKLHPDFDAAMVGILQEDPEGEVILFMDNTISSWSEMLKKRFERTIPDAGLRARIHFSPWLSGSLFTSMLIQADVLLDPFPFGSGTTGFLTNSLGIPLVTLPGEFMRCRSMGGCYEAFGVTDTVAVSPKDYVAKAVALAKDPERKRVIGDRLREALAAFKEKTDSHVVDEFVEVLLRITK